MLLTNGAKDALTVSRNPTKDTRETDRNCDRGRSRFTGPRGNGARAMENSSQRRATGGPDIRQSEETEHSHGRNQTRTAAQ